MVFFTAVNHHGWVSVDALWTLPVPIHRCTAVNDGSRQQAVRRLMPRNPAPNWFHGHAGGSGNPYLDSGIGRDGFLWTFTGDFSVVLDLLDYSSRCRISRNVLYAEKLRFYRRINHVGHARPKLSHPLSWERRASTPTAPESPSSLSTGRCTFSMGSDRISERYPSLSTAAQRRSSIVWSWFFYYWVGYVYALN